MHSPSWLERLRAALRRHGLPPAYAERLADELLDHLFEMQGEKGMEANSVALMERLGDPEGLADAAAREWQARSWAGRHPVLTFVVAPVPVTFLVLTLTVVTLALAVAGLERLVGEPRLAADRPTVHAVATALHHIVRLVPFALAAWWFARLGRKRGLARAWTAAACLIVAVTAATFLSTLQTSDVPGQSTYMMGFGIPLLRPDQWVQAVAPMAIGAWFLLRPARPAPEPAFA